MKYKTMATGIPKVLFQKTRFNEPNQILVDNANAFAPDWRYIHFSDSDMVSFILDNPIDEFPNAAAEMEKIKIGAYKSDFFRYYYMYLCGGFFLDDDVTLFDCLTRILGGRQEDTFIDIGFVCNRAENKNGECVINNFIGSTPKNPIIRDALEHMYSIDKGVLNAKKDYLVVCKFLYTCVQKHSEQRVLWFYENPHGFTQSPVGERIISRDTRGTSVFAHYAYSKIVPRQFTQYDTKYGRLFLPTPDPICRLFEKRVYPNETFLKGVCTMLPNEASILDVGAFVGTASIFFAKNVSKCRVLAFEPQRVIYNLLNMNISNNKLGAKITTMNKGLFSRNGVANLTASSPNDITSTPIRELVARLAVPIDFGSLRIGSGGEVIEVVTIDSLKLEKLDYIHCTAQGAEPYIFASGVETIKRLKPIISFLTNFKLDETIASCPESKFDVVDYCEKLGYTVIRKPFGDAFMTVLVFAPRSCDSRSIS